MKRIGSIQRTELIVILLLFSVSAVLAQGHFRKIDYPKLDARIYFHQEIIDGTAESPYRYRILVPKVVEGYRTILSLAMSEKRAFLISYGCYELLAIFFTLFMLWKWLRIWFSAEHALIGVLFVASTMSIALQDHYFQPWSLLEAGLFSTACIASYQQRYWLLVAIVALASFNRETAIFIPAAYFLLNIPFKKPSRDDVPAITATVLRTITLFVVWAVIFVGLRVLFGSADHALTLNELFQQNMSTHNLILTCLEHGAFPRHFLAILRPRLSFCAK